ncbi:type VII secretion protein EccB [Pseudonocardia spinosispora]|uniref:type VII secretion protein EccB n=1 Tax=Pseudonocardia spinosispora TaxID=103441 RepID=UPI00040D04CB|nr:type VII secretion protein EccB [Pseudonocardia spinosispora]
MAKEPVSRMQIDAYRFGQRRLESALARRDPVLLHEVIRGQRRSVALGVILASLVGMGMFAYVKLSGTEDWARQQIIQATGSGRMYVVIHRMDQPKEHRDQLVPVSNLVAARLVYKAASAGRSGLPGLVSGSNDAAHLTQMDDAALATAERTAESAVVGAPGVNLPSSDAEPTPVPGAWAMCDTGNGSTAVIAGARGTRPLEDKGVLLSAGGVTYLVTGGKKYPISGEAAFAAYDLRDHQARRTSTSFTGLIPDGLDPGDAIAVPRWSSSSGATDPRKLGQVVRVSSAGQPERFYLIRTSGVAELSAPLAYLIRVSLGDDMTRPAAAMSVDQVNAMPRAVLPKAFTQYPANRPVIQDGADARSVCWEWRPDGKTGFVSVAPAPPAPDGQTTTTLVQSDQDGPKLDQVSLPGGFALAAAAVAPGQPTAGGVWLVSDTGIAYPVQGAETVQALGITATVPVPADALMAMPRGLPLDIADANKTVDQLRPDFAGADR